MWIWMFVQILHRSRNLATVFLWNSSCHPDRLKWTLWTIIWSTNMSLCEIYAAGMVPNSIGQYHLDRAQTLHNTVGPAWPERSAQLIYRPIGEQILCCAQKRAHSHVSFMHTDQPALSVSASGRRGSPPGSRSHPRSPPPFPPILTSSPGRTSSF